MYDEFPIVPSRPMFRDNDDMRLFRLTKSVSVAASLFRVRGIDDALVDSMFRLCLLLGAVPNCDETRLLILCF